MPNDQAAPAPSPGARGNAFPSTHWSVGLAAGASGSTVGRTAWDQLAQAYWQPVYHHARRKGGKRIATRNPSHLAHTAPDLEILTP